MGKVYFKIQLVGLKCCLVHIILLFKPVPFPLPFTPLLPTPTPQIDTVGLPPVFRIATITPPPLLLSHLSSLCISIPHLLLWVFNPIPMTVHHILFHPGCSCSPLWSVTFFLASGLTWACVSWKRMRSQPLLQWRLLYEVLWACSGWCVQMPSRVPVPNPLSLWPRGSCRTHCVSPLHVRQLKCTIRNGCVGSRRSRNSVLVFVDKHAKEANTEKVLCSGNVGQLHELQVQIYSGIPGSWGFQSQKSLGFSQ